MLCSRMCIYRNLHLHLNRIFGENFAESIEYHLEVHEGVDLSYVFTNPKILRRKLVELFPAMAELIEKELAWAVWNEVMLKSDENKP